jgi:acyl-CoA synthetase (AMP-forming)/AMP-acid ligase II
MQSTMMGTPLNLSHFLERAGKLFGAHEIVSRMPDKSLHRYTYADFYRRAAQPAAAEGLELHAWIFTMMRGDQVCRATVDQIARHGFRERVRAM